MIIHHPNSYIWHTKPEILYGLTQTRIILIPHFVIEDKIQIFWYVVSLSCDSFLWNIDAKISYRWMCQRHYLLTPHDAVIWKLSGGSLRYHGAVPLLLYFSDHSLNWILIMDIWIRYVVVNTIMVHSFHEFCAFLTLLLWTIEIQMIWDAKLTAKFS